MCEGFGLIVTKDNLYFIEPDVFGNVSHSAILRRLGWNDNTDQVLRHFVRVEYPDWTTDSFRFDEDSTLPGWVDEAEIKTRCDKVLERVCSLFAKYELAKDTAYNECNRVLGEAENYKVLLAIGDAANNKLLLELNAAYAEFVQTIKSFTGYVA